MPNEPAPGGPPIAQSKTTDDIERTETKKPEVEYDDFGLPIRKPRPRTPLSQSSDSDSDNEVFKDAVASKSADLEKVSVPEVETVKESTTEKHDEQRIKQKDSGTVVPVAHTVNGQAQAAEQVQKTEVVKDDAAHPTIAKDDTEGSSRHLDTTDIQTHKRTTSAQANANSNMSEFSHQQLAPETQKKVEANIDDDGGWQTMPAYARYDMYDDDDKLVAREKPEELEDMSGYGNLGGAAKGYTRVTLDDDAESQTSMDDHTAYLFGEKKTNTLLDEDDEAARDPLSQMEATKNILTEGQRVAYVGLVRLAIVDMFDNTARIERTRGAKKVVELAQETMQMWGQKMMVRLYTHMDIDSSEQIMIEQLSEHGVIPADLTPALVQNARVKNPIAEEESESPKETGSTRVSVSSPRLESSHEKGKSASSGNINESMESPPPPPYQEHIGEDLPAVQSPSELPETENLDIDLRWTILCDLFLVLIADSIYDARSRHLLEQVGKYLSVDWLEICRFEKRVTDALEMQEEAVKENWNEDEHVEARRKRAKKRRIALMGLATVGGGLVIGLSAGLLAPVIGAGFAAGLTTIGLSSAGTAATGFLASAGGAAIITTTGVLSGGTIAVRAADRRTGAVKTFEYRPLHNNKRVNLIITVAGWMNGKVDDVRLPYSTVDPIMGDIYSILWEPEMLRSMGDTINILATEALTQGLQQVLGSTVLVMLMSAIQIPMALSKLSYLIDNPWTVSQARADMAGLILADSLIERNLGTRPITLVGFSLGARVIFAALRELAKRGAFGLVQNVYLFGTPVVAKKDDYLRAKAIVPGRFVNGYATNDWILGYLFRATSGGIMRVAGLAPVLVPGVENINVTEYVPGHMAYRAAMPKLLREVGWIVESDEFAEIEDPDPENHDKRQRELINEIEEARKELEKKPEKKGFSFWRKKKGEKKDWEVYDENSKAPAVPKDGEPGSAENPVLFDIEAIQREVAALSAQGIDYEIKEIKSTLPPLKIESPALHSTTTTSSPPPPLRETKSYNDSLGITAPNTGGSTSNVSTTSNGNKEMGSSKKYSFEEYDEFADGGMSMTFETSFKDTPSKSHTPPAEPSWVEPAERPALKSHATDSNVNLAPNYNAWADEFDDDFGKEKDLKMTFA
ncbi:hypothetical protein B0J11DRAFT_529839 [Dendryphion nanum]|uniref:DUF726-domain-containing protein n=1 Tax=Dendryphion nanum TaxID=256645 RepID=A0A9P9DN79_9PLEO|nr:hypothetical protein B0J11DRAFT_529839 [Dendryphion nanum]